ncbi:low affinity immunoglobulin gamma Fc region receptor III-A-like [Arvicanthis niloticus]|uniref:low affinity immunoglobulin gamma Fc region receptor III-A-like n=1 Tax=Arvicanthis niloticus TaxID=61156 RepID=UPI00402BCD1D
MWQLLLSTALVLTAFSGIQAGLQKAVVILDPEWVRVLEEDNVTLRCQGTFSPEDNSTKWFHNESLILHQDANYFIKSARVNNSGMYRCKTALSTLSDPVRLDVHIGWLLLQTTNWWFQEGDPIRLRCHSWKNKAVNKVTYLQNGKGKKYFHKNSEFCIPKATHNDSGSYFCRGLIGQKNKSSASFYISIGDPTSPLSSFPPWHQITFCLLIGLLFAIDTMLYFSVQRGLQSSVADYEEPKFHWSKEPQDK